MLHHINSNMDLNTINFNKKVSLLSKINETNMKNMMSGFFANNNPSLDNLLASADFKQFYKNSN